MDQDEACCAGRPQPWPHCVIWGPSSPSPKGHSLQFSAHVCCGQMAGWIKMALGMEVGLGPGHIVLDGDPASLPKKGAEPSIQFSAHVYCGQNGWMDEDATLYGSRPRPSPASPTKGAQHPQFFSADVYCGHGRPSQLLLSSCLLITHSIE